MSKNTIFNNKYIGWILFIMVIAGYSAYWVDNNRDFNTVIFDENNKVRDIEYIATEYHKLFKDTDWENMPEFKPLSDEELGDFIAMRSVVNNNNIKYEATILSSEKDKNIAVFSHAIIQPIDSTNSVEDMVSNLKPAFEVLEKAYPKDRELLDNIYTEIPMHFTKYTNQENYQEKEYQQKYTNVLEKENMDINSIYIYTDKDMHIIYIGKALYKKEK